MAAVVERIRGRACGGEIEPAVGEELHVLHVIHHPSKRPAGRPCVKMGEVYTGDYLDPTEPFIYGRTRPFACGHKAPGGSGPPVLIFFVPA